VLEFGGRQRKLAIRPSEVHTPAPDPIIYGEHYPCSLKAT
jgi:hypothetical protein